MTVTDDEGSQGRQRSALGREERAAQTEQAARRDSSGSSVILRLIRRMVKPGGAVDGVMMGGVAGGSGCWEGWTKRGEL